ncbi:septal ring lytic transglycosylase RlpA family protein [Microvirga arabica]|uniref:septal ring lytic transglycosylase RlpA family protein n=1 Tax=Microvirga arabica TaxID=1128671 RepID=UPI00193A8078|nr:septal ring lytic transglycosylase RlpA family protein [Microvirga arabica]MBM1172061.1 septal ring lytic transglycosylase RlpA family protein [Microvirga arabica]
MRFNRAEANTGLRGTIPSFTQPTLLRVAGVTAIALMAANCSSNVRGGIDPKYGVAPSPKVVADGQPVPKGGGREMVGKPYTVAGRTYVPNSSQRPAEGLASWYGANFHGRMTANGEVFDRASIAAAHTTMPLPSYARVTNLQNGHSMIVRVNDRGPFHGNRVIDVSERAAMALGFKQQGTARVRVEYVGSASTNGSDDRILMASLRTDGQPASLTNTPATMIAQAAPQPNAPRQAIALRSYEPDSEAYQAPARASQPSTVASAAAGNVPLPPERPFDLGTIPGAASPVARVSSAVPGQVPAARPVVASLYEAPASTASGFQRNGSSAAPSAQRFVLR